MSGGGRSLLPDAIRLAVTAHEGQVDKAGCPYILHPLAVLARVAADRPDDETAHIAAVLHDVAEDTWVTLGQIEVEFGGLAAEAVNALTRREGETYRKFIERAAENPTARVVKLADIDHNLSRMDSLTGDEREGLTRRYERARRVLAEAPR